MKNLQPEETQEKRIFAYTDGSCKGNPGPGGWGYVLRLPNGTTVENSGGASKQTTNNRMEMIAVISALETISETEAVTIVTDSKYVSDGVTSWMPKWKENNWVTSEGSLVANIDLWLRIDEMIRNRNVEFRWISKKEGNAYHNRADELAKAAAEEAKTNHITVDGSDQGKVLGTQRAPISHVEA